jgi:hypothetical protein
VGERVLLGHVPRPRPDHHRQLALVVELAGVRRPHDVVARAGHRGDQLGEDHRLDRDRHPALERVGAVVVAHAEQLARAQRRRQAQVLQRHRVARLGGDARERVAHVAAVQRLHHAVPDRSEARRAGVEERAQAHPPLS